MEFIPVGERLVERSGKFAIWCSTRSDYELRLFVGRADGATLYEFSTSVERTDTDLVVRIRSGLRQHEFDESLLGMMPDLLNAALPSFAELPGFKGGLRNFRLEAPSDIVEHVAFGRRGRPVGTFEVLTVRDG